MGRFLLLHEILVILLQQAQLSGFLSPAIPEQLSGSWDMEMGSQVQLMARMSSQRFDILAFFIETAWQASSNLSPNSFEMFPQTRGFYRSAVT